MVMADKSRHYLYTFMTFCLSVENMVTLHPCFCFFMKALLFLTTFQTSSEDIYQGISHFLLCSRISKFVHSNLLLEHNKANTYIDITITKETTAIKMDGGKNWVIPQKGPIPLSDPAYFYSYLYLEFGRD